MFLISHVITVLRSDNSVLIIDFNSAMILVGWSVIGGEEVGFTLEVA